MRLSVIIPTYNRPYEIDRTLKSIISQNFLPNEVIVVDQSDNHRTKDLIQDYQNHWKNSGVQFMWLHQYEKSSAKARNHGFHVSKGEIISFVDDDIILDKDYFNQIVKYFDQFPSVGGISGNIVGEKRLFGFKWMIRTFMLKIFLIDFHNGKMTASGFGYPIFFKGISRVTPVELLSGYNMNFRRMYFERNQFSEWFTGYSFREDVDLSYRISCETEIVMIPNAKFEHHHSLSNRTDLRTLKQMQFRNYYYVFNKHKNTSFLSVILFSYSVFGILLIDFLECLTGFRKKRLENFKMSLLAVFKLMIGRL